MQLDACRQRIMGRIHSGVPESERVRRGSAATRGRISSEGIQTEPARCCTGADFHYAMRDRTASAMPAFPAEITLGLLDRSVSGLRWRPSLVTAVIDRVEDALKGNDNVMVSGF